MFSTGHYIKFLFSPGRTDTGSYPVQTEGDGKMVPQLNANVELLKKANRELAEARRAASNMMEDAVNAKEALQINQYRIRRQKEALQSSVNGAALADSLHILADLAIEETGARTAFYIADENSAYLHPAWGAGNMPKEYLEQIDGFVIGEESLACGLAIPTGKPVITEDVFKEPLWKQWAYIAEKFNFRGCWSFPIMSREKKAIGTFAFYFIQPRKASADDVILAEMITQTASVIISYYVTEQQRSQTEQALRNSEEKLRILNASLEQEVGQRTADLKKQHEILKQAESLAKAGSWEYDIKTKEFLWSDGMYNLFGLKKREPVQPEIYLRYVVHDDRAIADSIVHSIRKSFAAFEETMRVRFNGSYRLLRIKAAPLKNQRGEPEKMLGVNLDVTETKLSEAEIARLNASISEVNQELRIANMDLQYSNEKITKLNESIVEVNNTLASANTELKKFSSITANNYTESLRHVYINLETIVTTDARNLSNSSRANLRRAQAAIQKMKLLTHDIHDYLQLYETGGQKQMVDLNTIIRDVITKLKPKIEETNAQVNIGNLPEMLVDPELFSRLVTNLIDNAIKFRKLDIQPVIRVNYSEISKLKSSENGRTHQSYFVIEIADNGIGFENTERVFELFSQLATEGKYKGAGMGLPICKKIMEMHGGFITADSKPGEGSVFSCYFPRL